MDPAWVVAAISLATVIAGLLAWFARWFWRAATRLGRFIDDFYGEPAIQGQPAKPGVMERLGNVELITADIRQQVHLNSGHSLKDTVTRTERAVRDVRTDIKTLSDKVDRMGGN